MTCFEMYRSSSYYPKPKDRLRFPYSIVILLWFYHSRFVLLVVVLGGILRVCIPCYCYLNYLLGCCAYTLV